MILRKMKECFLLKIPKTTPYFQSKVRTNRKQVFSSLVWFFNWAISGNVRDRGSYDVLIIGTTTTIT